MFGMMNGMPGLTADANAKREKQIDRCYLDMSLSIFLLRTCLAAQNMVRLCGYCSYKHAAAMDMFIEYILTCRTSTPLSKTLPWSTSYSRDISRTTVDLPQPEI